MLVKDLENRVENNKERALLPFQKDQNLYQTMKRQLAGMSYHVDIDKREKL
jgi:hypothetical protein